MATIDLNTVAQRAKAAGKNAEQFIRECFEAAPGHAKTPMGGIGSAPLPFPNVSVAQRPGGLPLLGRAPGASSGSDVAAKANEMRLEAAEFEKFMEMIREAIKEDKAHFTERLRQSKQDSLIYVAGRITSAQEMIVYTQEKALQELMAALLNVYGVGVRQALEWVLRRAEAVFRWQQGAADAMQEQMARFVFLLGRVTLRVSSTSTQKIAEVLCWVALRVGSIQAIIIPVIICILTYGVSNTIPARIVFGAMNAAAATIRSALAIALTSGISLKVILRTGVEVMGGRILDWVERLCEAWLMSRGGTTLLDLVRELHRTLGLTAEWIAYRIIRPVEGAVAVEITELVNALAQEFGRDANLLARAVKAAFVGVRDGAVALKSAGFSALETGRALKDEFGLNRDQVTSELRNVGFSAEDVMRAVLELFRESANRHTDIVNAILR